MLTARGVQVAIALGVVSAAAVYMVGGDGQGVVRLVAASTNDVLRADILVAVPLLVVMNEFLARAGAAGAVARAVDDALQDIPHGVLLAAGAEGTVHAFAADSSTASVAAHAGPPYGALRRRGYDRAVLLGTIASAAVLGRLLPPSVLLLMWGIFSRQAIEALWLAALIPVILIAAGFILSVLIADGAGVTRRVGLLTGRPRGPSGEVIGLAVLFGVMLGGLAMRVVSPAEAAAAGTIIAFVMALRGGMRVGGVVSAAIRAVQKSLPILLLIFSGLLFARALALTSAGPAIGAVLVDLGPALALSLMIALWLVLATLLDAPSALVLTATLVAPAAATLGFEPLAFAVLATIVLESAALLPPFGLLAYVAKAAVNEDGIGVLDIFRRVLPFLTVLVVGMLLLIVFPKIATWLPHIVY